MYILFGTGRVSAFIAKLRSVNVSYDVEYGVKLILGRGWVLRADMTDEQQDVVEALPNVTAILPDDPRIPVDDPLSGCDEERRETHGCLEGCDEPGDPDD